MVRALQPGTSTTEMSALPDARPVSLSTAGYQDGLGRRSVRFDREVGGMLECLRLRAELGAFEASLEAVRGRTLDEVPGVKVRADGGNPMPALAAAWSVPGVPSNLDRINAERTCGPDPITRDIRLPEASLLELDDCDGVFLSVDIDVCDPGHAPGTGTPEPGGLSARELLDAVRRICLELPVVGIDVVEVAPPYDHADITAALANRVVL